MPRSFNNGSTGAAVAPTLVSDTRDAPRRCATPREDVDHDRDQEHAPRNDVLQRCRELPEAEKRDTVCDPADQQTPEQAVNRLAPGARETRRPPRSGRRPRGGGG